MNLSTSSQSVLRVNIWTIITSARIVMQAAMDVLVEELTIVLAVHGTIPTNYHLECSAHSNLVFASAKMDTSRKEMLVLNTAARPIVMLAQIHPYAHFAQQEKTLQLVTLPCATVQMVLHALMRASRSATQVILG